MKNTSFFKALLVLQTAGLLLYTGIAIQREGGNFVAAFVGNILQWGWSGQFNADFACYLLLSGLWIMWRNRFETRSIVLGLVAMVLGIVVFAPYVLYLLMQEQGDLKKVLVGRHS
jgi:hypothetical protein